MKKMICNLLFCMIMALTILNMTACDGGNADNESGSGVDVSDNSNVEKNEKDISRSELQDEELPEDNQANHGPYKVMETELGYYYNLGLVNSVQNEKGLTISNRDNLMNMFFFDKEAGIAVQLCDKPECHHQQTNDCVATYNKLWVIGQDIYDGYLYTYGEERDDEISRFSLYRTALDGSAIDRVGVVMEAENKSESAYIIKPDLTLGDFGDGMIIHKGYAYLPYYLRVGTTMKGFKGGGIKRMNLKTGETETVFEMPDSNGRYPYQMIGDGDYIYFLMIDKHFQQNWFRYDTKTGIYEKNPWEKKCKGLIQAIKNSIIYTVLTEENLENDNKAEKRFTNKLLVYKITDDESVEQICEIEINKSDRAYAGNNKGILVYKDYYVVIHGEKLTVYSAKQENFGNVLGELAYDAEWSQYSNEYAEFKINNDKIYRVYQKPRLENEEWDKIGHAERGPYINHGRFYQSCPIEDIIKGKGEWTESYRTLFEES